MCNYVVELKSYDKDFNLINSENLAGTEIWKGKSRLWGDKSHRISSYIAMFSPALANYFIEKYTQLGDIVLDTFSGRGTTLLEARLNGRKAYAIDLNPFAFVLTKAKSRSCKVDVILDRIDELEVEYKNSDKDYNWEEDLEIYYSKKNLSQISFIKQKLGLRWETLSFVDNFILATTLGIMHGPMRKDTSSLYLSVSMSNHTSMSKNYVKRFASEHNLQRPEDNIFKKIKERAKFIISQSKFCDNEAFVKYGDALEIGKYFPNINPKLIFTSPPYLNLINYTSQNWLKMWLLGFETREKNKKIGLSDNLSLEQYFEFMKKYLWNISRILQEDTRLVLVIGDVLRHNKFYSFEQMWNDMRFEFPHLYIEKIFVDNINPKHKINSSIGITTGGATRVDKIYVFRIKSPGVWSISKKSL